VVGTDALLVAYRPIGRLAIMPWNFPFWQVLRFAMPALVGGNGALLKHAPTVPGCALALENLVRDAGFPEGLFRALIISVPQVKSVIRHRHVAAVSLTGSTAAGKAVAREAGARLKKCVLELGGSDPYVVLEDADLEGAVEACAASRLINSGQSCIAPALLWPSRRAEVACGGRADAAVPSIRWPESRWAGPALTFGTGSTTIERLRRVPGTAGGSPAGLISTW
jgi:acyl-CoA reductase-like NAD-dependent aldehyde dehydrogenase